MPSTTSSVGLGPLASSTVMTPSLPTLSMASAMMLPMSVVAVGGDGADLGDLLLVGDGLRDLLQVLDDGLDGLVDAALEVHRVGAGGDGLQALAEDRLGEHGGRGGAVAGDVGGLGGDLLHHLRAHVLELVLELDFLGDGDAVLGDGRGAEGLVDDDVAALGAERDLDRVGQDVDATQHLACGRSPKATSFAAMFEFLLGLLVHYSITPMMSSSRITSSSSLPILTSVPEYSRRRESCSDSHPAAGPCRPREFGSCRRRRRRPEWASLTVSGMTMPLGFALLFEATHNHAVVVDEHHGFLLNVTGKQKIGRRNRCPATLFDLWS